MEIGEDKRGTTSSSSVNGSMGLKEKETSNLRRGSAFNILNALGDSKMWKRVFLLSSVIALWLDPLFFYIITVNEDKKCLLLDRQLGIAAVVLRCSIDFIHIIYVACDFYFALLYRQGDVMNRIACKITRRYLLSCVLLIDILAILPLPQALILRITTILKGSRFLAAVDMLKFFVIFQFVPRVLRLYPLYISGKEALDTLAKAAWAKALLNLFLYMLLSHVLGALWYLLAIERETTCWREACRNHPGCSGGSFFCDVTLRNHTFLNDFCPISSSNRENFDFGIYRYALESGIVQVTNFSQKFLHCFRWGLQNLSSCGQNLQTSAYIWENIFAVFITISGLLSFLLLIGNMQIYLQTKTMRNEERRLEKLEKLEQKRKQMKEWKPSKKLPGELQEKIIENLECISGGLDLEKLHQNLPEELSIKIRLELAFDLLKKMPLFRFKRRKFLETLCYHVKPVVYSKGRIIQKGRISNMLFIVQGQLKIQEFASDTKPIKVEGDGYFFGEELHQWLFSGGDSLPKSNIHVVAHTLVEAFALESDDLKRNWAAMALQSAWQHCKLRRIVKEAVEKKERRSWARELFGTTDSKSSHAALATWEPFKKLSGALQWKVKEYIPYKIRDFDLVMLLHKLPKELSTAMKEELCFDLLIKVEAFRLAGRKLLNALCFSAKPVLYMEGDDLLREGDTVDQMLFIVQGKLQIIFSTNGSDNKVYLKGGDFCGEEIVQWVWHPESSQLPISSRTIRALTKVEAFALQVGNLKRNWDAVHRQAAARVISALRKRFQEGKHSPALGQAE